ncbi:hypothetical protein JYT51_01945, partial [Candidatus Amoebophilus asiaticus]|nr:hypothetical protein [Candidatus Amoebophilus asiaticus]
TKKAGYAEDEREVIYVKLIFEHEFVKYLTLSTRFEPYYDLNNKLLEYSYGIHAVFNTDIFLTKLKR